MAHETTEPDWKDKVWANWRRNRGRRPDGFRPTSTRTAPCLTAEKDGMLPQASGFRKGAMPTLSLSPLFGPSGFVEPRTLLCASVWCNVFGVVFLQVCHVFE